MLSDFTGSKKRIRPIDFSSSILSFTFKQLGSDQVIALCENIGAVGKVKILQLGENKITDDAIPVIITHLILNEKMALEKLDLGGNEITENGAQLLMNALTEIPFSKKGILKELYLSGNPAISAATVARIELMVEGGENPAQIARIPLKSIVV